MPEKSGLAAPPDAADAGAAATAANAAAFSKFLSIPRRPAKLRERKATPVLLE